MTARPPFLLAPRGARGKTRRLRARNTLRKGDTVEEIKRYVLVNWFELASLGFVCVAVPLILLWTAVLVNIERHLRGIREELEIGVWPSRNERSEYLIPR